MSNESSQATTPPDWLKGFVERVETGTIPRRSEEWTAPTEIPRPNGAPADWPDSFMRLCSELRLAMYRDDLAAIQGRRLPDNDFFRAFRAAWKARSEPHISAVLSGGKGAGKSVCALWACLETCRDRGGGFDFLDLGEFADLWALQDRDRIHALKRVSLLVVDEVGDIADVKGPAFALFKRVVNARYRNKQPTILCSTDNLAVMRKSVGEEIVDRFKLHLGSDSESFRV